MLSAIGRFLGRPRNLGVIAAGLVATAMVVAAMSRVWDPDVWWVAAAGREMLARHAVQTRNLFSYVEPGHAWLMHEWLFGVPYALALEAFGPSCFPAIAVCAMACSLGLLSTGTIARSRHVSAGLLAFVTAVAFFGGRFLSARPTGVALVFPLAMVVVAFGSRFGVGSLVVATGIELVWANAHGSFPLGIAILGVAWLEHRGDVRRAAAIACGAAVTLATPHGWALHRFVWGYFSGIDGVYRAINVHIREFGDIRSAWGATVGPVDVAGLLLVTIVAASAVRHARHRVRALFCLGLVLLAMLHARHLELAGLVSCVLLVPWIDELWDRAGIAEPPTSRRRVALLVVGPGLLAATVAFAVANARRGAEDWIASGPSFLRALAVVPDGGDAFVPFPQAGLAIWYAFPRGVRVFFDPRNDCYSVDALESFWSLEDPSTSAQARRASLDASRTDAAVLPAGDALAAFLGSEPGWRVAAREGSWDVFLRTEGRARREPRQGQDGSTVTAPGPM